MQAYVFIYYLDYLHTQHSEIIVRGYSMQIIHILNLDQKVMAINTEVPCIITTYTSCKLNLIVCTLVYKQSRNVGVDKMLLSAKPFLLIFIYISVTYSYFFEDGLEYAYKFRSTLNVFGKHNVTTSVKVRCFKFYSNRSFHSRQILHISYCTLVHCFIHILVRPQWP